MKRPRLTVKPLARAPNGTITPQSREPFSPISPLNYSPHSPLSPASSLSSSTASVRNSRIAPRSSETGWERRDGIPGPFKVISLLESGAFGQAAAVRELDPRWSVGGQSGRVMCMKVFNKKEALRKKHVASVVQELLAYKTLAWAGNVKGKSFVMELDAALEDETHLYFAMVRLQFRG